MISSLPAGSVRLRFAPLSATTAFAGIGAAGILMALPGASFEDGLARRESADAIAGIYLRAWLRIDPDSERMRFAMAMQEFLSGHFVEAQRDLMRLSESSDKQVRVGSAFLRLEFAERSAYALEPGSEAREHAMRHLHTLLRSFVHVEWSTHQLGVVARKARAAGLPEIAGTLYMRLADRSGANATHALAEAARAWAEARQPDFALALYNRLANQQGEEAIVWLEEAARVALAHRRPHEAAALQLRLAELDPHGRARRLVGAADILIAGGDHSGAARRLLDALAASSERTERRALFKRALATYQAASRFDEALAAADRHGAEFLRDVETVEFLARLALAGNRPDVASRYARLMLKLSAVPAARSIAAMVADLLADVLISSAHASEGRITLPFSTERYRLAFDIFLGNKELAQAREVAAAAVRHSPEDPEWRKRYAEVAEWDGQPVIALDQWFAYAKLTGSDHGWDAVLRLAPGLFDHERWIAALERKRAAQRDDEKITLELAELYEDVGRARDALALLRAATARSRSKPILLRLAQIAERVGEDRLALETYDRIVTEHGAATSIAVKQAALLYVMGTVDEAWQRLDAAKHTAQVTDRPFWSLYAQVSQFVARHDEAIATYRNLYEQGSQDVGDLANLIGLLQAAYPVEAASVAEYGYRRFGRRDWLLIAFFIYSGRNDWTSFARLLADVRPEHAATLERDHDFLAVRAQYFLHRRDPERARADMLAALAHAPKDASTRAPLQQALVWQLVAQKHLADLRRYLREWRKDADGDPNLWSAFAAGHLLIGDVGAALRYYARAVERQPDDRLLMLAYASALEQAKQTDRAWALRRKVWVALRAPGAAAKLSNADETGRELFRSLVEMSLRFGGPDASAVLLGELLRRESAELGPAAKELILAWAFQHDATDLAHAWYLRQYANDLAHGMPRPYWAELSLALAADDRKRIERLLDDQADQLPLLDRIEAARRIGRDKFAETLAFDALARTPADDELHQRFTELAGAAEDVSGVEFRRFRAGELAYTEQVVRATHSVMNRTQLGIGITHRSPRIAGGEQIGLLPRRDNLFEASIRQRFEADEILAVASRRVAVGDATGARIEWRMRGESLSTEMIAGKNQSAPETSVLRIGGMKDTLAMAASWRFSKREYLSGSVRADRLSSQSGAYLGSGRVAGLELGHRVRTEYPDLTVRATMLRSLYRPHGELDTALAAALPPTVAPESAAIVPRSSWLYGAAVGFGTAYREERTRALRPFVETGLSENSVVGRGYTFIAGVAGSVVGGDRFSFYFSQSKGARGVSGVTREFGISYRF